MPLTIDLPPDTELKLQELAARSGQDLPEYALTLLLRHVEADGAAIGGGDLLAEAVARMTTRTAEQIGEARARAAELIRPGKPLPQGETIFGAVAGRWPGDETDEQVAEALRKLS